MIPLVSTPMRAPRRVRALLSPLFLRDPEQLEPVIATFDLADAWQSDRVRQIVRAFLTGYNAAVLADRLDDVHEVLRTVPRFYRPFAYEGAGMGFGPWALLHGRPCARFDAMTELAPGTVYQNHVGLGWWLGMTSAWRPWSVRRMLERLDRRYRLLPYEGLGFRAGFLGSGVPSCTLDFGRYGSDGDHVCHQGFGRSLWFVHMGDVRGALFTIARLDPRYHGDCYSGLGLGCAFSWLDRPERFDEVLAQLDEQHRPDFLQGAAFGWEARQLADRPLFDELLATGTPAHRARVLDAVQAVHDAHDALVDLDVGGGFYLQWRRTVRERMLVAPAPRGHSDAR